MKKGDLSINMIIIIAIGLVILLVVIYLLISRSNTLRENTLCIDNGGVCVSSGSCDTSNQGNVIGTGPDYCKNLYDVCCKPGALKLG